MYTRELLDTVLTWHYRSNSSCFGFLFSSFCSVKNHRPLLKWDKIPFCCKSCKAAGHSLLEDAPGDGSDVACRARHSCGKFVFFFRADPIEFCFHRRAFYREVLQFASENGGLSTSPWETRYGVGSTRAPRGRSSGLSPEVSVCLTFMCCLQSEVFSGCSFLCGCSRRVLCPNQVTH